MISNELIKQVVSDIKNYCHKKGVKEGPGVNNFIPHNCVNAFAMAHHLVFNKQFDHYIAVAPEGFIYSYFFEIFKCNILSVYVDFPPINFKTKDDMTKIKNSKVLIIEDDIMGGATLRLVVKNLQNYAPNSMDLYLGHTKGIQQIKNVPDKIQKVYLAEDMLSYNDYTKHESDFIRFFQDNKRLD